MKGNTCPFCGAPFKSTSSISECEFCGYSSEIKKNNLSKQKDSLAQSKSFPKRSNIQEMSFQLIRSNHSHESILKIILLTCITCGLYYLYKLFIWTEILNTIEVQKKDKMEPSLVIIFSILSCGLAAIYYHYDIAKRALNIAKDTSEYNNSLRNGINKPRNNLPKLILLGYGISLFVNLLTDGEAFLIVYAFSFWSIIAVQRAVEYAAGIKRI